MLALIHKACINFPGFVNDQIANKRKGINSPKKQAAALSRQLAALKTQHSAACQQVIALGFEKQNTLEVAATLEEENTRLRKLNDSIQILVLIP